MTWIEANGISLRYELTGRGDPIVILVHEMGGVLESWDEALPGFQQHFRTLRYDQRGFGMSEKPIGKVTIDDLVDLTGLLDALRITTPCHIVSSALGTATVMAFAVRHPGRVARMAVESAVTGTRAERREAHAQRAASIEREGMRANVDKSLAVSYPEQLRANRERFEHYRCRWLTNKPASYVAMADMVADLEITAESRRSPARRSSSARTRCATPAGAH